MCTCPIESVVATSSMLICHYWNPYLSEREIVLEAQLIGLKERLFWELNLLVWDSGRSSIEGFQLSKS
jgi:hypothetical protein